MSSVVIAGDTSGSVTLAAPSIAGTTTLTLPSTSGTVVTTNGGVVPTSQLASGTASSSTYLRGDSTWASISSGGMTLLGTLTTTSGTTQTLSGLTLTNYKQLSIAINGVGFSTAATNIGMTLASVLIMRPIIASDSSVYGIMTLDLSNGAFMGVGYMVTATNTGSFGQSGFGNLSSITTSTTSLSFGLQGEPFTRGTIKVYGVA